MFFFEMTCHVLYFLTKMGLKFKVASIVVKVCLKLFKLPSFHAFLFSPEDLSLDEEYGSRTVEGLFYFEQRNFVVF